MKRPTLAFIDHSFHQKSRSGDFLRDIFREYFDVVDYWDESWKGGSTVPPETINKHDVAFYFQSLNPIRELKKIKVPIVWAPMYDGIKFRYAYWKTLSYLPIKVVSFSIAISEWLERFPIPTLPAQYYVPQKPTKDITGERVFFWNRGDISFDDIKRIIDPSQIESLTYFENPDKKGQKTPISEEDKVLFKMRIIDSDFLPKEEYSALVEGCSTFVAPRRKEGIGMSFIEALSMGRLAIGYDDATFNEYVDNGKDGYVFDEETGKLDLTKSAEMRAESRKRYSVGFEKWLSDREKIAPFILEKYAPKGSLIGLAFWSACDRAASFLRKVRYYILVKTPRNGRP